MDAWLAVFMIASHIAYVPTISLATFYVYPIDIAFSMMSLIFSLVYHLSAIGLPIFGDLAAVQRLDHIAVWSLMLWLFVRTIDMDLSLQIFIQLSVMMLFLVFSQILVDSWLFPLAMIPSAVVIYMIRLILLEIPLPRISITFLAIGIVYMVAGMVCFYITSGYGTIYKIFHPFWHICSGLALFFFYVAILGFTLDRYLFDLDRRWSDWLDQKQTLFLKGYRSQAGKSA